MKIYKILLILCFIFVHLTGFVYCQGLGNIPLSNEKYQNALKLSKKRYFNTQPEIDPNSLPSTYNAIQEGIVTPCKDQNVTNCGSCWAFTSVAALESHILKAKVTDFNKDTLDLSEQQLMSCNVFGYNCLGGFSRCYYLLGGCGAYPRR